VVRDLRRLADSRFDLLVVGAGFYGAIAAWDATLRGLSVALIDKDDFGAATSFNNLKTLHGGLRSLQSANFKQMRLFIRERRALARVAPHLVQPLPFVVPTYRHPMRSAAAMRAALAINDAVARDRHDGISDPSLHLPAGRVVSRAECLRLNPVIDPRGVTGGAIWHDYQMHNTDRMTLSFVLSAAGRGAVTANYVAAESLLRNGTRVAGVRARDACSGDTFEVTADTVLNATGPWAPAFVDRLESHSPTLAPGLSRAMNLVTRRVDVAQGCGGRAAGRFLFLAPWRHVTLVGTSHDAHDGSADALSVSPRDIEAFLADARAAFPGAALSTDDVRLVHRGLLPMVSGNGAHVKLLRESLVVDHANSGVPGLVSMLGVRYTTARATAESAIDAIFRQRGVRHVPVSSTAHTPISGGAIDDKERFIQEVTSRTDTGLSADALRRLAVTYGTEYASVVRLASQDRDLAEPLGRECTVIAAEIVHAVRHESAVRLTDALLRRTEAGSAGYPGSDAVARAAAIMARECEWDAHRTKSEVELVDAFYKIEN
jgi:glycerol-3-phosphate dehydrogenase